MTSGRALSTGGKDITIASLIPGLARSIGSNGRACAATAKDVTSEMPVAALSSPRRIAAFILFSSGQINRI